MAAGRGDVDVARRSWPGSGRGCMSPPGRPKGSYRSAQHEGTPVSPPGRPKGSYRSAQHEGTPMRRVLAFLALASALGATSAAVPLDERVDILVRSGYDHPQEAIGELRWLRANTTETPARERL